MLCHHHLVTIYSEVWSLLQNQELSMKQYNRTPVIVVSDLIAVVAHIIQLHVVLIACTLLEV